MLCGCTPSYNLIGRKIAIGQVEISVPDSSGYRFRESRQDFTSRSVLTQYPCQSNIMLIPTRKMLLMISSDKALRGVAPGARLYSTAVGSSKPAVNQKSAYLLNT